MSEIVFSVRPATKKEIKQTFDGLNHHTKTLSAVLTDEVPFGVQAYKGKHLAGNLSGKIFWNWLYIDLLWVDEQHREQTLGTQLMLRAENEARAKNLSGIYLWTQSWQAAGFYQKLGYEQFCEFKDFPPGHTRYGFRKYLFYSQ